MRAEDVIEILGYSASPDKWVTADGAEPGTAHLWRTAHRAKVFGSYVYNTSPASDAILPPRAAVHVARAADEEQARDIHRNLWNLSSAPFLLVVLPHQVRVYAGFNFDPTKEGIGCIETANLTIDDIRQKLKDFYADEIDSGRIWQTQAANLTPERRVDQRLLASLERLGDELVENRKINRAGAHALIGKYIYIWYLIDRRIVTDRWLNRYNIRLEDVVGKGASKANLLRLINALESRFNGMIFPLDLTRSDAPSDDDISYVASVFRGDDPTSGQLALDFQAYDFSFIPVEMLSSIYEQFLRREGKGKDEGAVYTREFVADYLLCELNSVKPLRVGMRVLDPACGSGVFLVLVYRRLIEEELRKRRRKFLPPDRLREILVESIFGVEPSRDACYVTEFSLILTLLSYVDPPDLEENEDFQFPVLHNTNIFECDFFDGESAFWKRAITFHWITGNPPWTKLNSKTAPKQQPNAWQWLTDKEESKNRPVGKYSLSEAFSWRVTDVLTDGGCVGLLLHATSLFNSYSANYRKEFFKQNTVLRVTNFSNLVYILFKGRADAPAATFIYRRPGPGDYERPDGDEADSEAIQKKPKIIHYGPFVANQVFFRADGNSVDKQAWAITIYEDEIQIIDPWEAETGDVSVWKLALWGNYRDRQAVSQFKRIFPESLGEVIRKRDWNFHQGVELRNVYEEARKKEAGEGGEDLDYVTELETLKILNVRGMSGKFYLTVPPDALVDIPEDKRYVRTRGGQAGLRVAKAPHIFWSTTFAAYSDLDFVLPAPQVGLSGPAGDADYLRAVSAFLNSSIGQYLLFFHAASWGVDRSKFAPADAKPVPIPSFSGDQVRQLAELHRELSETQTTDTQGSLFDSIDGVNKISPSQTRRELDNEVGRILRIPGHLRLLAADFTQVRYQLNKGKTTGTAAKPATVKDLTSYARHLMRELNDFAEIHHRVSIKRFYDFVLCTVEITRSRQSYKPIVEDAAHSSSLSRLWKDLEQQFSQWVYVRRSLRTFAGKKVYLLKSSRLIDWTRTQALLDSDDIIAEVLNSAD